MSRIRFAVIGNHASYHCGSRAVMDYLRGVLPGDIVFDAPDAYDAFRRRTDYDVLVVNGEGSMHHGAPTFRLKMEVVSRAVSLGKKVHLVNTLWQENPSDFDALLRHLKEITVREVLS